ncbi:MAG: hypothetical protein PHP03_01275 [Candidatus Pacebacteria bacterium]|nr:hypothetical protein [Candidatus Paceibacterota bacterium]
MINRIFYVIVAVITAFSISISVSLLVKKLPETKVRNDYQGLSAADLKKKIQTPLEAQKFMEVFYGPESFCAFAARAIAFLIADDGYEPFVVSLDIVREDFYCHFICIFKDKETGLFGASDNGVLGYIKPKFKSPNDLLARIWRKEGYKTPPPQVMNLKGLLCDDDYFSADRLKSVLDALDRDKLKEKS